MKLILSLVLLFGLSGCSFFQSTGCAVSKAISVSVAPVVATSLNCSNAAAISTWLDAKMAAVKICTAPPPVQAFAGVAGAIFCQPIIDMVAQAAVNSLPGDWGCAGGSTLTDAAKLQLLAACQKAL